jgi:hypothetical protein
MKNNTEDLLAVRTYQIIYIGHILLIYDLVVPRQSIGGVFKKIIIGFKSMNRPIFKIVALYFFSWYVPRVIISGHFTFDTCHARWHSS